MNNKIDVRETTNEWKRNTNKFIVSLKKDVEYINIDLLNKLYYYFKKYDKIVTQVNIVKFGDDVDMLIEDIHNDVELPLNDKPVSEKINPENESKNLSLFVRDYISIYKELKSMCNMNYYNEINELSKYKRYENYSHVKSNLKICIDMKQLKSKIYMSYLIKFLGFVRQELKNEKIN